MDKIKENIYVTKTFLPPMEEYVEKIKTIWTNKWVTNNGPLHNELELKLNEYLNVRNSTLFTNGHLALDTAIKALNLKGEVITTPFTFASTTHAIVMNGLKPVFCDINKDNFTIDTSKIEELINENTCAIIPVHVFGYPCDIVEIEKIARKYNLKIIYDAAHVFGVKINGCSIGNYGDISMFSLHATKVYNSIEGGVLTYNSDKLKHKLETIKNFGISGPETVEYVGLNAKMNEFQAAMGVVNLKYINDQIVNRKKITNIYRENLMGIKGIYFLTDMEGVEHNYSYFPILIDEEITGVNRDELHEKLKRYKIFTRKYFYPLITDFECYKGKYSSKNLENAKYVSERILTLPIYGELEGDMALEIVKIIKEIFNNKN